MYPQTGVLYPTNHPAMATAALVGDDAIDLQAYCGQTFMASFHHMPEMSDELEIGLGDYILLEDAFVDG